MVTYDKLLAYAENASYAGSRATVDELPAMVRRAQDYIVSRLDHDLFADEEVDIIIREDGMIRPDALPGKFLEIRSLHVKVHGDEFFPILPRDRSMLDTLFFGQSAVVPKYYARVRDREYKVYPRPYESIEAKIWANVAPADLNPSVQENLLTKRFPHLFEVGILREVAVFNIDQPMVALYEDEMTSQLNVANAQVSRHTRDETAQRPRETRNVVGS